MAQEDGIFRLRLAWPRAAEDMPIVQMAAGSLHLVMRVPAAALGRQALIPELPAGNGPVRALTVQIAGDQGLIVLRLRHPVRYEMRSAGAAWLLELDSRDIVARHAPPPAPAPAPSQPSPSRPGPSGPAEVADGSGAETMLLDVVVNGRRLRDVVQAERISDGRLVLPAQVWNEAGLRSAGAQIALPDGGAGYALDAVEGLIYTIDRRQQALSVTAPPAAFVGHTLEGRAVLAAPPPRPRPGFLLNYDLSANLQAGGSRGAGANLEGIYFGPFGNLVSSMLVNVAQGRTQARRLDTFWQYDLPHRMESVVVGDTIGTGGAWSRPVRYGGLRWGTDFGLRPGFVTIPQPTLAGVAALPSTVEVLVNRQQRLSRAVGPGAFELRDVPIVTGAGELNLVVRDLLGRETVVRQNYYVSPRLLAADLDDYSVEAGWLRTGYGGEADTYGDPFAAATWRRGLTPALTVEMRGELERGRQAAGVEVAGLVGSLALARGSVAASRSDRTAGTRLMLGLERTGPLWGGAVQWERYGAGFRQLAQASVEARPRDRLLANIGGRVMGPVSAGLTFTRQTNWDAPAVKVLGASLSARLPQDFSLSVFYSRELTGIGDWRAGLTLTRAFGGGVFAAGSMSRGADGQVATDVLANSTTPSGPGVGWRVGASGQPSRAVHGGVTWNTTMSELTADAEASREGAAAARLGLRGSLGWLAGLAFASRPVGRGSFAVVRVGDLDDVPVLRSHQVVTRTNRSGLALVPGLLPYQPNVIEIDPTEISLDAELSATRLEVVPYARSGVTVDFGVKQGRSALVQLVQVDGSPVPVDAEVRLGPNGPSFKVARRGEVYMTGLEQGNSAEVAWPGHRCNVVVQLPRSDESLPRIGPLACAPGAPK